MPSMKILKNCWEQNSDGFGLAYHGKRMPAVAIIKGAMKFKHAVQLIESIPEPTQKNVLMHFRWASHGSVCPGNCHPFPLSSEIADLTATKIRSSMAIAHNGVITGTGALASYTRTNFDKQKDTTTLSDTQEFIRKTLADMPYYYLYNKGVRALLRSHVSSKLTLLTRHGFILLGDYIEDGGIYYSNSDYRITRGASTRHNYAATPTRVTSSARTATIGEVRRHVSRVDEVLSDPVKLTEHWYLPCLACGEYLKYSDGISINNKLFFCSKCYDELIESEGVAQCITSLVESGHSQTTLTS